MEGSVVRLRPCQTFDPARGSFMVHPLAVKSQKGGHKNVNIGGIPHPVFRAANTVKNDRNGNIVGQPHPEAIDFVVVYKEELLGI